MRFASRLFLPSRGGALGGFFCYGLFGAIWYTRVKLRIRQFVKDGKLASEYMVIKVLEQRKAPKQIKLDFPYRTDDNEPRK